MAKIALAIGIGILGAVTGGLGLLGFAGLAAGAGGAILGGLEGLAVGSALGNLLFPMKLPDQVGPRLSDLTVSSSTNGAPIPIGYGTFRYAGNIIWSPGLIEHAKTTKVSAKGGPSYKSTTYTYTASFAVAFGEGQGDIIKVWFDSKIAYDNTTGTNTAGYPAPTLYRGDERQMPDPLIQGIVGVNRTPAFRGIIYGVWEDFLLSDWGNRIPNIQALVTFAIGTFAFVPPPPVI